MNTIQQIILALVAGLVTGVFATIFATWLLALSAWKPFNDFKKTGVIKVFKDQENATNSILKDIEKSSNFSLLAMRGDSFSNPDKKFYKPLLLNASIKQKYLISSLQNPYLPKRNEELGYDMSVTITASIKNIQQAQSKNKNIEIKQHHEVVRFRIIRLSHCLYLSFQEIDKQGSESPVLKIDNYGDMYKSFSTLYDDLWEKYPLVE